MGARGPAKEPRDLALLKGGRSDRIIDHPILVADDPPTPPDFLGPGARVVWDRVMAGVLSRRAIRSVDTDVLAAYCEAVDRHNHAARMLREVGPLVKGRRDGEFVKNPLHQVVRDNAMVMRAFARELGLSPAARAGIEVPEAGGNGQGAERFLTG